MIITNEEAQEYIRDTKVYLAKLRHNLDLMELDLDSKDQRRMQNGAIFSNCLMICLSDMDKKVDEMIKEMRDEILKEKKKIN